MRPNTFKTLGTIAIAVVGVLLTVRLPVAWISVSHPSITSQTVELLDGRRLPLLAPDSGTLILVLKAECPNCRAGAAAYGDLVSLADSLGLATRAVIVSEALPAAYYLRLVGADAPAVSDPSGKVGRMLRTRRVPALFVYGRDGKLALRRVPFRPDELEDAMFRHRLSRLAAGHADARRR
jgi:hypothetical protein